MREHPEQYKDLTTAQLEAWVESATLPADLQREIKREIDRRKENPCQKP